eukprot:5101746-Pleurochrysis_carterae.AAC.1
MPAAPCARRALVTVAHAIARRRWHNGGRACAREAADADAKKGRPRGLHVGVCVCACASARVRQRV